MSNGEVFATFGGRALARSLGALATSMGLIAAAIYGQIGPGVHANVATASGLSMVALAGALGKWLLCSLQIGFNILFENRRALYVDEGRIVFVSPIWMKYEQAEIAKVDIVHIKYKDGSVKETIRFSPRVGEPKFLPPGLVREPASDILARVTGWLG